MRYLGLDPGLRITGWGIVDAEGNRLSHVADGVVRSAADGTLADRLAQLHAGLAEVIASHRPDEAAVEEIFVNRNAASALKLGHARAIALLAPAQAGIAVSEYSANLVKKSLVGAGHADKEQVGAMVRLLLPGCRAETDDATDALAVAICHAHHAATARRWLDGSRSHADAGGGE